MTNILTELKELFFAIAQNDLEKIKKFKEQKVTIINAAFNQITPLGLALSLNREEAVKLLLEFEGINVNQPTRFKTKNAATMCGTPLSLCVHHNKPSLLQALLEKNADPNLANEDKSIPLMWALFFGHAECASLLFGKSNWESKNKNGLTVYDFHKASVMVGKDGYSSLYQYQQQHQCSHPALIAQFQASQPQVGSPRSLVTHAVEVRSASEPAVSEAKKKPNQKSRVTRQITKNAPSDSLNGFVAKIKNLEAQIASKDEFIQILRKEIGELKSLLAKQEVPTSSTTTSGGSVCIIDENKGAPSGAVGEAQNEKREDQENRQNQLSEHAFFNARKARIDFLLNKDDETILIPN